MLVATQARLSVIRELMGGSVFLVDSFTPLTSTPGAATLPAPCWAFGGHQPPREADVPVSWVSRASRGRQTTEMGNKQITVSVSRQTGGALDPEQGAGAWGAGKCGCRAALTHGLRWASLMGEI